MPSVPEPYFQDVPLRCARCGYGWNGYMAVHCSLTLAAASMKALAESGCPGCHAIGKGVVLLVTQWQETP